MAVGVGMRGIAPRPVDYLLLSYIAVSSVVALLRFRQYPGLGWVLVANAACALLIVLVRIRESRVGDTALAELYPILLIAPFYACIGYLNGGGAVTTYDLMVQGWEEALFGGQPSRDWWRTSPSVFWSTLLHGAYWSYYLILALPPLTFLVRRDPVAMRRLAFTVQLAFVPCLLAFIFFPVAGPYYSFPRPDGNFIDNPMARLVYGTLASGSSFGAAFPSSHVAASIASTAGAWKGWRPLGAVLVVMTTLMTVSVVYCQMHYAVDALVGVVVGGGAAVAAGRISQGSEVRGKR